MSASLASARELHEQQSKNATMIAATVMTAEADCASIAQLRDKLRSAEAELHKARLEITELRAAAEVAPSERHEEVRQLRSESLLSRCSNSEVSGKLECCTEVISKCCTERTIVTIRHGVISSVFYFPVLRRDDALVQAYWRALLFLHDLNLCFSQPTYFKAGEIRP